MAYNKKRIFSSTLLVVCLILFNPLFFTRCGLEKFHSISAPSIPASFSIPTPTSDVNNRVFKFSTTHVSQNGGDLSFQGTEIYYKIYADESGMKGERDKLISLSEEAKKNISTAPADRLIQTDSYGYGYSLLSLNENKRPTPILINGNGTHEIQFRLTSTGFGEKNLQAHFFIDGNDKGVPVRYNGGSFEFNIRENRPDVKDSTNKDVYKQESSNNETKWYIPFFAVSKGRDASYTNFYSNITYLGTVCIDDSQKVN